MGGRDPDPRGTKGELLALFEHQALIRAANVVVRDSHPTLDAQVEELRFEELAPKLLPVRLFGHTARLCFVDDARNGDAVLLRDARERVVDLAWSHGDVRSVRGFLLELFFDQALHEPAVELRGRGGTLGGVGRLLLHADQKWLRA